MTKKSIFLFICIVIAKITIGQEKENKFFIEIDSVDKESIFERTLNLLIKSNYFIVSTDKGAGFIQCKKIIDDDRLVSRKKGEVIYYNLLINTNYNGKININIQANLTVKSFTGSVGNSGYYDDDLGVTDNSKYIDPIIRYLEYHL